MTCFFNTVALAIVFNYPPAGQIRKLSSDSGEELPHHESLMFFFGYKQYLVHKQDRQIIFDMFLLCFRL